MATDGMDGKRVEFLTLAEAAFGRMFGDDGQNGLGTFAQREQRACEVTDELARWLMGEHVAQDPSSQAGVGDDCPVCGGPVQYESAGRAGPQGRGLMNRRGEIEYRRAGGRCPRCR